MSNSPRSDDYSEQETAKRRDDVLRRMIATPPTKHAPLGKKKKPSSKKPAP